MTALQETIDEDNRDVFVGIARHVAPFPDIAEAAMAVAYLCARVFARGTGGDYVHQQQWVSVESFQNNQQRYSFIHGSNFLDGPKAGYWVELEAGYWNGFVIQALRWSFRDQVRRWEAGLGRQMGTGIGFVPLDEVNANLANRYADLLFEYGARFYETEAALAYACRELDEEDEEPAPDRF